MSNILQEGELKFDFSSASKVEVFDDKSHGMSHCMKAVDFIVEWPEELWLVEVKDPDHSKCVEKDRKAYFEDLKSGKLFSESLGPKLKDSYLYLHLEDRIPDKPLKYFTLIGLSRLDPAILSALTDMLKRSIGLPGPNNRYWKRKYIDAAAVLNIDAWNAFTKCQITRI